jgi:hypothetical protein
MEVLMPLQATSGAASYDAFGGGVAAVPNYIEDVFSTWLYTGNDTGSLQSQLLPTGVDVFSKGGLELVKSRSQNASADPIGGAGRWFAVSKESGSSSELGFFDGATATGQQAYSTSGWFPSAGNNFIQGSSINTNGATYVSWTFRKQPKFFDVVTYTGNGASFRYIPHNLGSEPGCIMVKRTDAAGNWKVTFNFIAQLCLNSTEAAGGTLSMQGGYINSASQTQIELFASGGSVSEVNASGGTYVAYLFAHNAGGFGLTGTDNVISCGSFTVNSGGNITAPVNLGYEPQWVMVKSSDTTSNWLIYDTMRGLPVGNSARTLYANTSGAEVGNAGGLTLSATGFSGFGLPTSSTCIYIAIRRGPMRTPTTGTSVFSPNTLAFQAAGTQVTTNFPVDLSMWENRDGGASGQFQDRLRGFPNNNGDGAPTLYPDSTSAESSNYTAYQFWNTGFRAAAGSADKTQVWWNFRRAPVFFDEVCFQGSNVSNTAIPHNLGVVPELVISKTRGVTDDWNVWAGGILGARAALILNSTNALSNPYFNSGTFATASNIYEGIQTGINTSANVVYLFASCPGVSKVGSYTGTGTTQVINCGFTGGARFVLIKATSTTGNWLVWDSARGIVSGNDPYLALNSTAAEVTNTDWVDTAATGFELSNAGGNLANSNGVSYIFLAIS